MSCIEIAKFELLEVVLRSGGQRKPPNGHNHIILIVRNPSITFFPEKNWSNFLYCPLKDKKYLTFDLTDKSDFFFDLREEK